MTCQYLLGVYCMSQWLVNVLVSSVMLGIPIAVVVIRAVRYNKHERYVREHHKLPPGASLSDNDRKKLINLKNKLVWLSKNPGRPLEDAPDHIQLGLTLRPHCCSSCTSPWVSISELNSVDSAANNGATYKVDCHDCASTTYV